MLKLQDLIPSKKEEKMKKFQEFINEGEATYSYTESFSDIILDILQTKAEVKLCHWQTRGFAEHKSFDDFEGSFGDLTDKLVEVIMGKYGRPRIGSAAIEIADYMDIDMMKFFDHQYNFFTSSKEKFDEASDGEIINIIEEVIAEISKQRYLLTLESKEENE